MDAYVAVAVEDNDDDIETNAVALCSSCPTDTSVERSVRDNTDDRRTLEFDVTEAIDVIIASA